MILISVVGGIASFYFYFQILRAMWMGESQDLAKGQDLAKASWDGRSGDLRWNYFFVLTLSVVIILSLGMFIRLPGF